MIMKAKVEAEASNVRHVQLYMVGRGRCAFSAACIAQIGVKVLGKYQSRD